jgi:hypothetical protein
MKDAKDTKIVPGSKLQIPNINYCENQIQKLQRPACGRNSGVLGLPSEAQPRRCALCKMELDVWNFSGIGSVFPDWHLPGGTVILPAWNYSNAS